MLTRELMCDECNINNTTTSHSSLLDSKRHCDYVHLVANVSVFGMDYGDSEGKSYSGAYDKIHDNKGVVYDKTMITKIVFMITKIYHDIKIHIHDKIMIKPIQFPYHISTVIHFGIYQLGWS